MFAIHVSPEGVALMVVEHKEAIEQLITKALRNYVGENITNRILPYPCELKSEAL